MDKRKIKSQQQLMAALARLLNRGKKLESISVQAIVNEANVARSSFYRNFDNKGDFLDWVSEELEQGILAAAKFQPNELNDHPFQAYFHFLDQQREFYRIFVQSLSWPSLTEKMYLLATETYRQELNGKQNIISPIDLATYIVGAHVQITQTWLLDKNPRTPEQMAFLLTTLTRDGLLKGLGLESHISLPK